MTHDHLLSRADMDALDMDDFTVESSGLLRGGEITYTTYRCKALAYPLRVSLVPPPRPCVNTLPATPARTRNPFKGITGPPRR